MERKFADDDDFIKLLEEQFEEEARIMEEELFSDEDYQDDDTSPEKVAASYEKLVARLKADGVYREDDDARDDSVEAGTESAEKPEAAKSAGEETVEEIPAGGMAPGSEAAPRRRRFFARLRPMAKAAGILLVCVAGVFAASMTSEANRRYVIESIRYITEGHARVIVDNDGKNESINKDEYHAISEIERMLDVAVPEFYYRPEGFEFCRYTIQDIMRIARLEYTYHDNIIAFFIDGENEKVSSEGSIIHGENSVIVTTEFDGIDVEIRELTDNEKKNEIPSYLAEWKRNDIVYRISGKMEKDEFIELIYNIGYSD